MRYHLYEKNLDDIYRRAKKKGLPKNYPVQLAAKHPELNALSLPILVGEHRHNKAKSPTYFVEADVVELLDHSTFKVSEDSFRTPMPEFAVAWHKHSGQHAVLVTDYSRAERERNLRQFLVDHDVHPEEVGLDDTGAYAHARVLTLYMRDPQHQSTMMHCAVPYTLIVDSLENGIEQLGTLPQQFKLDERDSQLMAVALRRICALCVYVAACPDAVHDGLPFGVKLKGKGTQARQIRLAPSLPFDKRNRGPVKGHFRSAHFRSLGHERYKRDDNGNIRIVPVKACYVAGEVTPKYVVKHETQN